MHISFSILIAVIIAASTTTPAKAWQSKALQVAGATIIPMERSTGNKSLDKLRLNRKLAEQGYDASQRNAIQRQLNDPGNILNRRSDFSVQKVPVQPNRTPGTGAFYRNQPTEGVLIQPNCRFSWQCRD